MSDKENEDKVVNSLENRFCCPKFTIRKAKAQDLDSLVLLEKTCRADSCYNTSIHSDFLSPNIFFILIQYEDGCIPGYICCLLLDKEFEIHFVGVAPNFRNRGFGSLLLKTALEKAFRTGAEKAFLEVRKSNVSALNLYKKCGFREIFRRKSYYSDGEDALIMCKVLTEN